MLTAQQTSPAAYGRHSRKASCRGAWRAGFRRRAGMRMAVLLSMAVIADGAWALDTAPAPRPADPSGRSADVQAATDARPQYWFGVAVENLPPAVARQLKLKPDQGVIVSAVFPGSPAERAGLCPDDLLVELNGRPLTSQEELAEAANTPSPQKMGEVRAPPPLMQISQVVYLRDGDRHAASITPEPRPANMRVSGSNSTSFIPKAENEMPANRPLPMRNIVLSSGVTAAVGPGYQVEGGDNLKVLQQAVGKGQTVTITQETDPGGKIRNTISDGQKTYVVEAENLQSLPENYRPLAQQLLNSNRRVPAVSSAVPAPVGAPRPADPSVAPQNPTGATEERLQRLEQQNRELLKQVEELKQLLTEKAVSPAPASAPATGK
jgi:hypothetical protein